MNSGSISPHACSGDVACWIRLRTASTNSRTRGVSRTYSSSASGGKASWKSHTGSADPHSDTHDQSSAVRALPEFAARLGGALCDEVSQPINEETEAA